MITPIKPKDVIDQKLNQIPEEVIAVFNKLIADNWNGIRSTVYEDDVIALVLRWKKFNKFEDNWLDIEVIYTREGWTVSYHKPGYNEEYKSYYIFSTKE